MNDTPKKMLSIWFFVALVLGAFGIIVLAVGSWHLIEPPTDPTYKLANLHADFWWGIIMVVFATGLFWADRVAQRKSR
jgi:hypothetical protein